MEQKNRIVLVGCGGHAKAIVDSIENSGLYEIAGFVDEEFSAFSYRGYTIVGLDKDLPRLYEEGIKNLFVCIGYMGKGSIREKIYNYAKEIGFIIPPIVDSTAVVARDVCIGEGTYIGKNAIINSAAIVGKMAIINTAAIVEHDCNIGDYTHVAVGAVACGGVKIGRNCLIGANASVLQGKSIGDYSVIGMSSVVIKNIPKLSVAVGMPAKIIKDRE